MILAMVAMGKALAYPALGPSPPALSNPEPASCCWKKAPPVATPCSTCLPVT